MKPAPFDYHAPRTVDDAVSLLAEFAEQGGRVIAGGQSFVPMMAFRLARPSHLIDINRIGELDCLRWRTERCVSVRRCGTRLLKAWRLAARSGGCSARSRVRWPTRRSAIAARSAVASRMPIRRRNGVWWRQRWMRRSLLAACGVSAR